MTLDPRDPTRNATAEPCLLSDCATSKLGSVDTPMKPNYERLYNSGATRIPFLPSRPREPADIFRLGIVQPRRFRCLFGIPGTTAMTRANCRYHRRTEVQLGVKRACVHFNEARCDARSSGA